MRLTVWGVAGGVGVSTLVALTREGVRDGSGRPLAVSADPSAGLGERMATGAVADPRHAAVHDAGRFRIDAALAAQRTGKLVLVVPRTELGAALAERALGELAAARVPADRLFAIVVTDRFGGPGFGRAGFGGGAVAGGAESGPAGRARRAGRGGSGGPRAELAPGVPHVRLRADASLAALGTAQLDRLSRATRRALDPWFALVRAAQAGS